MRDPHPPRLIEGKHAILVVFAIGLIGAVGSSWYHRTAQRLVLEFWGPEAAILIVDAPRAEALRLAPAADDDGPDVDFGGAHFTVIERVDVSRAPGLIHLRQSLLHDGSFDWSAPSDDCRPQWDYALRFSRDEHVATVLVAFNCRRLKLAGSAREAGIAPLAAGLERFLAEQFDQTRRAASKP
ncbi:MAG TPA: hypothetical protein VGX78_03280 [Pirellulales bacterium]|jgi:hypothetical protein|nr:hypothetical protein [Pirellulales bacterium]